MNCCICGPVKNCGPYLSKILENMEKLGSLFEDYQIIIYYDKSNDNTLDILKKYQQKNSKMLFYVNQKPVSKFRTHNIANARNVCLNYVKENREKFPFFIMMDCDDVNCKNINIDNLKKYLNNDEWDGLSFNSSPKYYDIWGLSIYPYCFSYNHFEYNVKFYNIMQDFIDKLLKKAAIEGKLVNCISSFNGFSIYRTNKFLNTYYDGRVRLDIIPKVNLSAHIKAANSSLIFKQYFKPDGTVNVDGKYEDCEHRAFHIQARQNSGARIMISPDILFY
jgi:hypothetical protein